MLAFALKRKQFYLSSASAKFLELLKKNFPMKPNFEISVESRKLSRRLQFKWVRSDEVIYFLARKAHYSFLSSRTWTPGNFFHSCFHFEHRFFVFALLLFAIDHSYPWNIFGRRSAVGMGRLGK